MKWLLLLVSVCVGYSQGTNATLEGQVTDPSGVVIGGAMVRAVSAETGYTRVQATTNAGAYHLSLPVGPYELRVRVPNFGEYVRSGIQLEVGQTARIDVRLQVAKEMEIVNVDARAPLVDSGSNVIGNVATGRELAELPGVRPEHRAAHRRSMGKPFRIPAPRPGVAGGIVWQRGAQRSTRARHFQYRFVPAEELHRERARAPAVPRGVLQPGQPRQLRIAGQRCGLSELRPRVGGGRSQADAVRS